MSGRDHSVECDKCGVSYGGMNAETEAHECAPVMSWAARIGIDNPPWCRGDNDGRCWVEYDIEARTVASIVAWLRTGSADAGVTVNVDKLADAIEAGAWRPRDGREMGVRNGPL